MTALTVVASVALGLALGGSANARFVLVGALLLGVAAWALRQTWGAGVALLPVLLVPSMPTLGPAPETLVAAVITLAAAGTYFVIGKSRPEISWRALAPPLTVSAFALLLTLAEARDWKQATALLALSTAGVLVGTAIGNRQEAARVFALVAVGIALLALYETAIGSHVWPLYRSGNRFLLADDPAARRAFTTLGHPLIAGSGLAIMAGLIWMTVRGRLRIPCTVIVVIGSLSTVTRSAAFALVIALVLAAFTARSQRLRSAVVLALIAMATFGAVAVSPVLQSSISNRVSNSNERQTVRVYALDLARTRMTTDPLGTAIGGGIGAGYAELVNRSGIYGLYTYDNQYVTLLLDIGWIPMLVLAGWVVWLAVRARKVAPLGLSMLAIPVLVAAFTDVLVWPSMVTLSWAMFGAIVGARPRLTPTPLN